MAMKQLDAEASMTSRKAIKVASMLSRFQSVSPTVHLSDQVADALSAEIRTGRFTVGNKLPSEAALALQFSVSRTVVREAVSRLEIHWLS